MKQSLNAEHYISKDFFELERNKIFKNNWILLGLTQEFPKSSFLERSVAGISLVLGKLKNHNFRCYTNICRHRGGPLLWKNETQRGSGLSCHYHGWSYSADNGILFKAPNFGPIDCTQFALEPWTTKILKNALIFVNHNPTESQAKMLDIFDHALIDQHIPSLIHAQKRHLLKCNWKIYVENYLEGLHIPYLHPKLKSEIDMNTYHVKVHERYISHHVGAGDDAMSAGFWAYFWPNLALNFYKDGLSVERIVPIDEGTTAIEYSYLFNETTSNDKQDQQMSLSTEVTEEDIAIVEAIQKNIMSGSYTPGPLSQRHEQGIGAFQNWVCRALAS